MPMWINRRSRRRHVDPNCRAFSLSKELWGEEYDGSVREYDRMVEVGDDLTDAEREAIIAFTVPCILCVPGARALSQKVPFYFEEWGDRESGRGAYAEYEDDGESE